MLAKRLNNWYNSMNFRHLPWKLEKDCYKIWLSEILLQQTKAEAVIPYYLNFIQHYPTIFDLANANEQKVFRLWQGLGYYNRCKNLLYTAKYIVKEYNGIFPNTYNEIIKLKGIGPYTASAIASFAYNLPYAVVDGNVYRILSRLFACNIPIDSIEGKKYFNEKANELLDKKNPAIYNQAIMDLGATICKPKNPNCNDCPWQNDCKANLENTQLLYPVKAKKIILKSRYFHYIFFDDGKNIWIAKRVEKDIWQGLYEFVLQESKSSKIKLPFNIINPKPFESKQKLTHQNINCFFYTLNEKPNEKLIKKYNLIKVAYNKINNYGFSKSILEFLKHKKYL